VSRVSVQTVETAGGRTLGYEVVGDRDGVALFMLHGTPGCRLSGRHPDRSRVIAAGLRIVSYDRPGYGVSSRQHGRRVVDCVGDVAAIADQLGIDQFAVTGGSGGGPHALAVGARLPERVTQVACDVGGAPYDVPDLDWFAGMDQVNIREFGWALAGEGTLASELERETREILERLEHDPTAALAGIELSAADRAVLADPAVRESLGLSTREMFAQGAAGWIDDDLAFIKPWGFDVEELQVPVEIRYGATDVLVPPSHGEWLAAHVPHATVVVDEGGGHLSTPDQRLHRLSALVVG
jgi:pimeloyl-ACP methyl ester carboxylesterase